MNGNINSKGIRVGVVVGSAGSFARAARRVGACFDLVLPDLHEAAMASECRGLSSPPDWRGSSERTRNRPQVGGTEAI